MLLSLSHHSLDLMLYFDCCYNCCLYYFCYVDYSDNCAQDYWRYCRYSLIFMFSVHCFKVVQLCLVALHMYYCNYCCSCCCYYCCYLKVMHCIRCDQTVQASQELAFVQSLPNVRVHVTTIAHPLDHSLQRHWSCYYLHWPPCWSIHWRNSSA